MDKIVYVIAQGHTGSTLLDCILGTHPDVISSGEMCYLNYQIERSRGKKIITEKQGLCTCSHSFLECRFWKSVASDLYVKTGLDILEFPQRFDRAFFGLYSYKGRGGHPISKESQKRRRIVKKMLLNNDLKDKILNIEPKISKWVKNEWELCNSMSKVGGGKVVVDSSKDITKALLMHMYYPDNVVLIFIHRDIKGLTASFKRRIKKKKGPAYLVLPYVMLKKYKYESMTSSVKKLSGLTWMDIHYEEFVRYPLTTLIEFSKKLKLSKTDLLQTDDNFYIEPHKHHIVAGNPMRFRGEQKVKYDERWSSELKEWEVGVLNLFSRYFIKK